MSGVVFLALLIAGLTLSIAGTFVNGLLWLTVIGMLLFLCAAAYAALAAAPSRSTYKPPGNGARSASSSRADGATGPRTSD